MNLFGCISPIGIELFKCRDCFWLILEFMEPIYNDYEMPVLKNLLGCLSPIGAEFFKYYIQRKPQFILMVDKFTTFRNETLSGKYI